MHLKEARLDCCKVGFKKEEGYENEGKESQRYGEIKEKREASEGYSRTKVGLLGHQVLLKKGFLCQFEMKLNELRRTRGTRK